MPSRSFLIDIQAQLTKHNLLAQFQIRSCFNGRIFQNFNNSLLSMLSPIVSFKVILCFEPDFNFQNFLSDQSS